jgi:hypothetical protein
MPSGTLGLPPSGKREDRDAGRHLTKLFDHCEPVAVWQVEIYDCEDRLLGIRGAQDMMRFGE